MATMEDQFRSVVRFIKASIESLPPTDPQRAPIVAGQLAHLKSVLKTIKADRDDATNTLTFISTPEVTTLIPEADRQSLVSTIVGKMNQGGEHPIDGGVDCTKGQTMLHLENYIPEALWTTMKNPDISLVEVYGAVAELCMQQLGLLYLSQTTQKHFVALMLAARKKSVDTAEWTTTKNDFKSIWDAKRKALRHKTPLMKTYPSEIAIFMSMHPGKITTPPSGPPHVSVADMDAVIAASGAPMRSNNKLLTAQPTTLSVTPMNPFGGAQQCLGQMPMMTPQMMQQMMVMSMHMAQGRMAPPMPGSGITITPPRPPFGRACTVEDVSQELARASGFFPPPSCFAAPEAITEPPAADPAHRDDKLVLTTPASLPASGSTAPPSAAAAVDGIVDSMKEILKRKKEGNIPDDAASDGSVKGEPKGEGEGEPTADVKAPSAKKHKAAPPAQKKPAAAPSSKGKAAAKAAPALKKPAAPPADTDVPQLPAVGQQPTVHFLGCRILTSIARSQWRVFPIKGSVKEIGFPWGGGSSAERREVWSCVIKCCQSQ